jgi:hypothetical protein
MRKCAYVECGKEFVPRTHNSIYCDQKCQRAAALWRYHNNKKKANQRRVCLITGCDTILSRYNKEDICEAHKIERYIQRLVSWGWDESKLREELK